MSVDTRPCQGPTTLSALYCTTVQCSAVQCSAVQCTAQHLVHTLLCSSQSPTAPSRGTKLHCTETHYTAGLWTTSYYTALHCTAVQTCRLQCSVLRRLHYTHFCADRPSKGQKKDTFQWNLRDINWMETNPRRKMSGASGRDGDCTHSTLTWSNDTN